MFKSRALKKPRTKSIVLTLVFALVFFISSHMSAILGYLFSVLTLIMIIVAIYMHSIWPTYAKPENTIIFAVFWGLMLGLIFPFLLITYIEGGLNALFKLLSPA